MHIYILWSVAGAAALIFVVQILVTSLISPLRKVPGPLAARFTRLWYFASVWHGDAEQTQIRLHRQYAQRASAGGGRTGSGSDTTSKTPFFAPVVRLGPNMYSLARAPKEVFGVGARMAKSAWYEGWKHPSPDRWTLFPDRDIGRHAATRRKFQALYALSSVVRYETFVDAAQDVFRARLGEMAARNNSSRGGAAVDLHHWLQCYAFDVIGNLSFGRRFGFLDAGDDIERCMASLNAAMTYSTLVGIFPWTHPLLYSLLEKFPGSGAAGRSFIMRFVTKLVTERRGERAEAAKAGKPVSEAADGNSDVPRDFLDLMLDAEEDAERDVTAYHVFMMGLSNVIAGSDTTAVSLSSVLYRLIRSPRCLARLREELDQAVRDSKMTPERIDFRMSQDMPYLQACIKEGLRLCTAVGLPLWREVPHGGEQILGHYFPAGSEIGINPWVSHYDQDIWGEDAAEFRPERWTDADTEQLKFMDAHYMPFGLGSRTCLGRHISYLEICKVIPMVVSLFDFELKTPDRDWHTSNSCYVYVEAGHLQEHTYRESIITMDVPDVQLNVLVPVRSVLKTEATALLPHAARQQTKAVFEGMLRGYNHSK